MDVEDDHFDGMVVGVAGHEADQLCAGADAEDGAGAAGEEAEQGLDEKGKHSRGIVGDAGGIVKQGDGNLSDDRISVDGIDNAWNGNYNVLAIWNPVRDLEASTW